MPKVRDILLSKGFDIVTAQSEMTIADCAKLLKAKSIGAVVVSDEGVKVQGIISERDIVRAFASNPEDILSLKVSDIMTKNVTSCSADHDIEHVMRMMTDYKIRHVPVMSENRLIGVISIGDVVKYRIDTLEKERKELYEYIGAR